MNKNETNELANAIYEVASQLEKLNTLLKSDATNLNIAEVLGEIAYQMGLPK